MWDTQAAGCLAGQLSSFISSRAITDLVVITHSNGGNVMRWILSNPTWDSRYPNIIAKIRWVNAFRISDPGLAVDTAPVLLAPMATMLRDRTGHLSLATGAMRSCA